MSAPVPAVAPHVIVNAVPAASDVIVTVVVLSTAVTFQACAERLIAAVSQAVTFATVAAVAVKGTAVPLIVAVNTSPISTLAGVAVDI